MRAKVKDTVCDLAEKYSPEVNEAKKQALESIDLVRYKLERQYKKFGNMLKNSKSNAIEIIITKALLQIGFSPANNGFYFLRDAVKSAYFDEEVLTLITKLIYAPLAKEYKTSII